MSTKLDLYYLVTQGQFTDKIHTPGNYPSPDGFFIYTEEEIITVRRGGGSSATGGALEKEWYERKKKIKLNFSFNGQSYVREVIVDNINLSVSSANLVVIDKLIEVNLFDVTLDDKIVDTIKVDISSIDF
jgi:hypothetical protein